MMIHRKKTPLFILTAMLMVSVFLLIGANSLLAESSRSAGDATLTLTKVGDTITFGLETDTAPVSAFSFDIVHNGTISGTLSPCQSSIDHLNCNPMYTDETIRVNYYSAQTALSDSSLFQISVEDATQSPYCVNVENAVFVTADLEPITITNVGEVCELIVVTPIPTTVPTNEPTTTPDVGIAVPIDEPTTVPTDEPTQTPDVEVGEVPLAISLKSVRSVTSITLLLFIVMTLLVLMGVTRRFRSQIALLLLLCGIMALSGTSPTTAQTSSTMGDVNCDGDIDIRDALLSDQHVNGVRDGENGCAAGESLDVHTAACDTNLDGSCTAEDAAIIGRCDAGLEEDAFCVSRPGAYLVMFADGILPSIDDLPVADSGVYYDIDVYGTVGIFSFTDLPVEFVPDFLAEPNVIVGFDTKVSMVETAPTSSWGLDRIDQRALPLDDAYMITDDGTGVNAYIVDTGIRRTHNEFDGRIGSEYDAIDDGTGDLLNGDCQGHGTHVAGTVGGENYGVADGVTLHSVRVLNCNGSGWTSDVIDGINWINLNHQAPAVVNMSLGGGGNVLMDAAVQSSINNYGITYVVAAGNSASNACAFSPARVPEAITVGASSSDDSRAYFSNYGSCVDLFAPGHHIPSASNSDDSSIVTKSGTSMAAPHVAGAVALQLLQDPSSSPAEIEATMTTMATVDTLSNIGSDSPNRLLFVENPPNLPSDPCDNYGAAVPLVENIVNGSEIVPTLNNFSGFSVIWEGDQFTLWLTDQNGVTLPYQGIDFYFTSQDGMVWTDRTAITPEIEGNSYVRSLGLHEVQLIDGVYHGWRDYTYTDYTHNGRYGWSHGIQYITSTNGVDWTVVSYPTLIGSARSSILPENDTFHVWSKFHFDVNIFPDEPRARSYSYRTSSEPNLESSGHWYDGGEDVLIDGDLAVKTMRVRMGSNNNFEAFHQASDNDMIYRATSSDGVNFITQETALCVSNVLPPESTIRSFEVVDVNGEDWFYIVYRDSSGNDHIAVSQPTSENNPPPEPCNSYGLAVPLVENIANGSEIVPTLNNFSGFSVIWEGDQFTLWLTDQNGVTVPYQGIDFYFTSQDGMVWTDRTAITPEIEGNSYVRSLGLHEVQLIDGVYHGWRDYTYTDYTHNGRYGWSHGIQYITSTNGVDWAVVSYPTLIGSARSSILPENDTFHVWSKFHFDVNIFPDEPRARSYSYRTSSEPNLESSGHWYDGGEDVLIDGTLAVKTMRVRMGSNNNFEAFHQASDNNMIYRATSSDGVNFTTQETALCVSNVLPPESEIRSFEVVDVNGEDWFYIVYRDSNGNDHIAVSYPVSDNNPPPDSNPLPSPVANWSFDDGTTQDSSGNGNHGTLNNSATVVSDGMNGNAIQFGGVFDPGHMAIANSESLMFDSGFTASMWVNMSGSFGQTHQNCSGDAEDTRAQTLFAKQNDKYGFTGQLSVRPSSNDIVFDSTVDGPAGFGQSTEAGTGWGSADVYMDEWFHAVYTFSSNGAKVYVNGQEVASNDRPVDFTQANQQEMYLGINGGAGLCLPWWYPLDGKLDEIQMFAQELTQEQIQFLYENP